MIYFDNSATTMPYDEVLDTYVKLNQRFYGNASSLHNFGGKAEQLITKAREQIADIINVKPQEIIFTSGGTEANNLAIKGTAFQYRNRGNHIITTAIEHPSVLEPCRQLEEMGYKVTYIPVNSEGIIAAADVEAAITDETILVSIIHVNNEIGSIQPIKEIGDIVKKHSKIIYHVDNVQGVTKVPINLYENSIDLCTFSAHKFHGLKGSGFLFKRNGIKLDPLISGGNQEQRLRSGTENTGGIVAIAKALRMSENSHSQNKHTVHSIKSYLVEELSRIPDVVIHSPKQSSPYILNFSVNGLKGEVIVHALESEGIIISTTSACSSKDKTPSKTLQAMGVDEGCAIGAIRVSLSNNNTMEEAEQFIKVFKQTVDRLLTVVRRHK